MAVDKTTLRGVAGLSVIIGVILSGAIYVDYTHNSFNNVGDNDIYTTLSTYHVGELVRFYLKPSLTSDDQILKFVWDFHDGDFLYTSTIQDAFVDHTFLEPGTYTVSILALKGPISKIFDVTVTILPAIHKLNIQTSSSTTLENQNITFTAQDTFSYNPLLNYIWDFGDSQQTQIGKTVQHNFTVAGTYQVRLRGYTNESFIYTAFKTINVANQVPDSSIVLPQNTYYEDQLIHFSAPTTDSANDLGSLKYIWDFNDGLMAQGSEVTHSYSQAGYYTVNLTTIDNNGAVSTKTTLVTILNQQPSITSLTNQRSFYSQGESITTTAKVNDTASDMSSLSYNWSLPGDGLINTYPFFDQGTYNLSLSVTDNNGASTNATTTPFQVINVNPYVSLLNATSSYNISIRTWGTANTLVNISLFQNGQANYNYSILNQYTTINSSVTSVTIPNLVQPLNQYWDMLINSTNNQTYDTYVEVTFSFTNQSSITLLNHCTNTNSSCLASSYRFPIAPIDRGFPVDYNFSYFDPGHDNLAVTMDVGGTIYSKNVAKATSGPTTGSVAIQSSLPYQGNPASIKYYATDEHGGQSSQYSLPFTNYALKPRPSDYLNISTWNYFGYYIEHYATDGIWNMPNQAIVGQQTTFNLNTLQHEVNVTNAYDWHFGDGVQNQQMMPDHTFDNPGIYLVWVLIQDSYYDKVNFMWMNVTKQFPNYEPIVSGNQLAGNELNFTITGINDPADYFYYWDFGDFSYGSGFNITHEYTHPGNHTAILTLVDKYNQKDYYQLVVSILNPGPTLVTPLHSYYQTTEGEQLPLTVNVDDSPYNLLHLTYDWSLNNVHSSGSYVNIYTNQTHTAGVLTITDSEGGSFTQNFDYNVSASPPEVSLFTTYHLYGSRNLQLVLNGTISPTSFLVNSYTSALNLKYILYDKQGKIASTGPATFDPATYTFHAMVDVYNLETNQTINNLKDTVFTPADLTPAVNPSGMYTLQLVVQNKNNQTLSSKNTKLDITFDQDGDFLPDGLEILYTNSLGRTFDIYKKDSNGDNIVDPVDNVIGVDNDGDGLPKFYEDILGTSDNNPDTDGDGLTDGWGPMGELTHGTNPLKADSDGDGLTDLQEVTGWQVKLITPNGVTVTTVTSNPNSNDTDHDGINDYMEKNLGSNPNTNDTDHDGLSDLQEQQLGTSLNNFDSDFDGISDFVETNTTFVAYTTDVNNTVTANKYVLNPLSPDTDHDGVPDYQEAYIYHTIGTSTDSDQDGISDYQEIHNITTNPLKADTDGDKIVDGLELKGFNIPTVIIKGGIYGESNSNGLVIYQKPTVTNSKVHVTTNPLLYDSDGDGLSDGQEVLGNASTVSNPTMVDSDQDGIPDMFDSQKLISDYQPPQIANQIAINYQVTPSEQLNTETAYLTTSLSTLWNYVKGATNVVGDIIDYSHYWTKSCWTIFCTWNLHVRSWYDIATFAINRMLQYTRSNLGQIFPASTNPFWTVKYSNSINFYNFGMYVTHDSIGIPNGFNFAGYAELVVQGFYNTITGIISPTVNIQAQITDNGGLSKIALYQDGAHLRDISLSGQKSYYLNQNFLITNSGFTLNPTFIDVKVYDLNGNIREFNRTTSLKDFYSQVVNQGLTVLNTIGNFFVDLWDWTLTGINNIGNDVVSAVKTVETFVNNTYNTVANWVKNQFNSFWSNFVQNTVGSLSRLYLNEAQKGYDVVASNVLSVKDTFANHFTGVFNGTFIGDVSNAMSTFQSTINSKITTLDVSSAVKSAGDFATSLASTLQGTVVAQAIESLGDKAINILNTVIKDIVSDLVANTFGRYMVMLEETISTLATQFANVTIGSAPNPTISSFDLTQVVDQVKSYLGQITQPFSLLSSFISSTSPTKFSNVIELFFHDTLGTTVSVAHILKSMYTPIMAVGLAFYNIMQLFPSDVKSSYTQKASTQSGSIQSDPSQSATTTQSVALMKLSSTSGGLTNPTTTGSVTLPTIDFSQMTIAKWMALLTYGFTLGGNVFKEKSILDSATDRAFDKDVEISGYPTAYDSPQFKAAIGLMINGGIPAALATTGLEILPGLDEGTKENFIRLSSVGYTRFAVGLMYMVILVFMNRNGPVSFPGVQNNNAIAMEDIFFALNLGINIWDTALYETIVDQYVQPGFDATSRTMEIIMKYLDMVRDIVILGTNNGQKFSGRAKVAFLSFSYGFVAYKFVSLTLTLFDSYTMTTF